MNSTGDTATRKATFKVEAGETVKCTFTNTQQPGTLIVKKVVINDNGGSKVATDFTFQVNGEGAVSFIQDGSDPLKGKNTLSVAAGSYSVTEPPVAGYSTIYNNCSNVVVANGGTQICTITNDDQTTHLKLVKVVTNDNGGTAKATDWTLTATGAKTYSGAGGFDLDVDAGTYNLSEVGPAGYTTSGFDCGASVTLAVGETKTCTITNNDIAPSLTLNKIVVNNNGGTEKEQDFTLTATGPMAGNLVEQFTVNSVQSTPTYSTNSLQAGKIYRIEVSGTYFNGSTTSADAECKSDDAWVTPVDSGPSLELLAV